MPVRELIDVGIGVLVPADRGCHLHPCCVQCPRPACVYDRPPRAHQDALARHLRILNALNEGRTWDDVAAEIGVSKQTVGRAKRNAAAVEAWRAQREQDRAAARQEARP